MEFINDLLEYSFLQRAMFTAIIVGIISGVIGSFIILRGMALMGEAISHAVLPGVAISYLISINFFYGAVFIGLLYVIGICFVSLIIRILIVTYFCIVLSSVF